HWARELTKQGHKVRLLQARFVKAFVMGNKSKRKPTAVCSH
ncbi:IS110 family transposase, partial [Escherichia coli]|nr:IS110 family transposase [Escherichia coli]